MNRLLLILALLFSIISTNTFAQFNMDTRLLLLEDENLELGNGINASADVLMEMAEDGRFNLISFTIKNEWWQNEDGSTTNKSYNVCVFSVDSETLDAGVPRGYTTIEREKYNQARYPSDREYLLVQGSGEICSFSTIDRFYYNPETGTVYK
jgi:hypothetical protein